MDCKPCGRGHLSNLPHDLQLPLETANLLFLGGLMSTPWKGLVPLLGKQLTPMVQSTIGNPEITRDPGDALAARLR